MDALTCRLLPSASADGPHNMAADEALLIAAAAGVPSLRFYGWTTPTVSLGYFQPHADVLASPALRGLPLVRRASGGLTLVHHHELTYCLAVPTGTRGTRAAWLDLHAVIADALASFGIEARPHAGPDGHDAGPLCFRHFTAGDLMIGPAKVVGSAQRKQHRAVMQHGGILLAQSPHTPALPGIRELTGVSLDADELTREVISHLSRRLGWKIEPGEWTTAEREGIETLARERYAGAAWTMRR